jgi:hypothetical protein
MAFSETALATYIEIADVVLELVCASSTGKLRVRKVRNMRCDSSWFPYEIDLDQRTLRSENKSVALGHEISLPDSAPKARSNLIVAQ